MKRAVAKKQSVARAEDTRVCHLCGKLIVGEYDFVRTRRGVVLYFCKGMKCRKEEQ